LGRRSWPAWMEEKMTLSLEFALLGEKKGVKNKQTKKQTKTKQKKPTKKPPKQNKKNQNQKQTLVYWAG